MTIQLELDRVEWFVSYANLLIPSLVQFALNTDNLLNSTLWQQSAAASLIKIYCHCSTFFFVVFSTQRKKRRRLYLIRFWDSFHGFLAFINLTKCHSKHLNQQLHFTTLNQNIKRQISASRRIRVLVVLSYLIFPDQDVITVTIYLPIESLFMRILAYADFFLPTLVSDFRNVDESFRAAEKCNGLLCGYLRSSATTKSFRQHIVIV